MELAPKWASLDIPTTTTTRLAESDCRPTFRQIFKSGDTHFRPPFPPGAAGRAAEAAALVPASDFKDTRDEKERGVLAV